MAPIGRSSRGCNHSARFYLGQSSSFALCQGCRAFGKMPGCLDTNRAKTLPARWAACSISFSRSVSLAAESADLTLHFAVLIARIRQVAISSDGPIFGESGLSSYPPTSSPIPNYRRTNSETSKRGAGIIVRQRLCSEDSLRVQSSRARRRENTSRRGSSERQK